MMANNAFERTVRQGGAASGRGTAVVAGRSTRSLDVTTRVMTHDTPNLS
jgi:hypothetical protein